MLGKQLCVVIGAGTTKRSVEGGRATFADRRFHLLVYNASDDPCPAAQPIAVLDASIGLGPIDMNPGMCVDFLMGASSDRITRVVSEPAKGDYKRRIAVLGHDAAGKWRVLWSRMTDSGIEEVFPCSLDGRYVLFGNPVRALDSTTLAEIPVGSIPVIIREQLVQAAKWEDRRVRWEEVKTGSISISDNPVWFGWWGSKYYVWDVETHRPEAWDGAPPRCKGVTVLAAQSSDGRKQLKVLDVRTPMRLLGFM